MSNLTAKEIAASKMSAAEWIKEANEKTVARAKAEGWTFWMTLAPESFEDCTTGYDVWRQLACGGYSDAYKESYGIRPRRDLSGLTAVEIDSMIDDLYKDAERRAELEGVAWDECQARSVDPTEETEKGRVWDF